MEKNRGNVAIVVILLILVLIMGYFYLRANGSIGPSYAGYYAPNGSMLNASAYSSYSTPRYIYTPSSSYGRPYSSYSMPTSTSTSSSVYSPGYSYTTTYPIPTSGQYCTDVCDAYGNCTPVCQYAQ